MSTLQLDTAPTENPVSREIAKQHLKFDDDEEDPLIDIYNSAATQWAEEFTRRRFITQTWTLFLDSFPCDEILLPYPPTQSVTHIKYYDTNGALVTLTANTDYVLDLNHLPARIVPAPQVVWPSVQTDKINAVEIKFVAGYGNAATVPAAIKAGILLLIGHLYENRQSVTSVQMYELPQAVEYLLWPFRDLRLP